MGTEEKGRKVKKLNCCSGIHLTKVETFEGIFDLLGANQLYYLVENGTLLTPGNLPGDLQHTKNEKELEVSSQPSPEEKKFPLVVLGDDIGIDGEKSTLQDLEQIFERRGVTRVSLGSKSLLASHCIILFHYLLDSHS